MKHYCSNIEMKCCVGKNLVPYYSENNEQHKLSEEKVQKIIEKSHQLEKLRKEITELFYYNT